MAVINDKDIQDILDGISVNWPDANVCDIAYLVLCDTFSQQRAADLTLGANAQSRIKKHKKDFGKLAEMLKPFGVGADGYDISREENKAELIKLLAEIDDAMATGVVSKKDGLKMQTDIRVKLNDKFEMEAAGGQKRIIVVPQKHDMICPHTNKECTQMPTKEACIDYYKLKESR